MHDDRCHGRINVLALERNEQRQEEQHLQEVLEFIDREIEETGGTAGGRKGELISGKKELWEDLVYDRDDDWFEAAVQLTQQAQELSQHATSYRLAQSRAEKLEKLKSNPYFARLDFREEGEEALERIYIGTMSLMDDATHESIVYDWRAPVSGMYYDYGPGPAEYEAPDGQIRGEITLKRQFVIQGGKLAAVFDTGITIGDEMLKLMLGRSAEPRMKSIVTTIQSEQNRIIRETNSRYVFVQGAAGSGKTSAALQRIAYLLYRYRSVWTPEQVVLFSPNDVFNDYVSNVLPELGEDRIPQTTFFDYVWHRLQDVRALEHPYEQLEFVYSPEKHIDYEDRLAAIRLKASQSFAAVLDAYAASLVHSGVRFSPLIRGDTTYISVERLHEMFYETNARSKIPFRLSNMQERLLEEIAEFERKRTVALYRKMMKEPKYLGTEDELKRLSRKKAKKAFERMREDVQKFRFVDIVGTYRELFERDGFYEEICKTAGLAVSPDWERARSDTLKRLDGETLPYEDATPLLYLLEALHGASRMNRIRHIVVDEAQDYSPVQWAYLRRLFPNAGVTALGDMNQAIHATGVDRWSKASDTLFPEEETMVIRLQRSYRSTKQIVEFTRRLIPGGEDIEAFEREGESVRIEHAEDEESLALYVSSLVDTLRQEGLKSIAVITKTGSECEAAAKALSVRMPVQTLTKDSQTFVSGLVVLPSYLAKGLEFDAVIVWDAGKSRYGREEERKLFYTVCTRALHRLHLCYTGDLTPFLAARHPEVSVG
jgi:DNA helicase II / ATP-dependent DNA helicase PcrA